MAEPYPMSILEAFESAHGGALTYRLGGGFHIAPDPARIHWNAVLAMLYFESDDTGLLELRPLVTPYRDLLPPMPRHSLRALAGAWRLRYGLPDFQSGRRLAMTLDRYGDAIEADLKDIDIGAMWRRREWRRLLNLIDHIPRGGSWYGDAVSNDEEYAKAIAEATASKGDDDGKRPRPPMATWTPDVAITADLIDAVRQLDHTMWAVNGAKGIKQPEPYARPETAVERYLRRAKFEHRQREHEALVKRMLPHKR